jgi:hypothetical protein
MQREINRFVISRENNVVRVDFSRDPDPPAPRFPGATGLREIGDESASETKYTVAGAERAAISATKPAGLAIPASRAGEDAKAQ